MLCISQNNVVHGRFCKRRFFMCSGFSKVCDNYINTLVHICIQIHIFHSQLVVYVGFAFMPKK